MAYSDIQRLRQQSLMGEFDQLTPGMGGMDMGGYQPPVIQPSSPTFDVGQAINPSVQVPPGLSQVANAQSPLANTRVNPNQSLQATIDAINRVYTPESASRDRFNTFLDNAPERNDPSWGRKLAASAISWGSRDKDPIGTMEKIMHAPYLRDQADWQSKADPFYKAAELENRANINERTLAGNVVTAQTQADKLAETARNNDMRNQVAVTRNNIQQAKNEGLIVKEAGDRFVGINPQTKQQYDLGPSGGMTEAERINALGEWGVKKADAYGAAAGERARAANTQYIQGPDGNLYQIVPTEPPSPATPVGGMPTGTPTGTTNRVGPPTRTPTENPDWEAKRQQNRMQQLLAADPDNKEFIRTTDGGKTFRLVPPGETGGFMGWGTSPPTKEKIAKYDAIREAVFGVKREVQGLDPSVDPGPESMPQAQVPLGQGQSQTRMPRAQQEAEVASGRRVKVISPDGKEGTIPAESAAAAKAAGYIIVGSR